MLAPKAAPLLIALAVALASATAASAATIGVNTRADQFGGGSACSLREAINAANIGRATAVVVATPAGAGPVVGDGHVLEDAQSAAAAEEASALAIAAGPVGRRCDIGAYERKTRR